MHSARCSWVLIPHDRGGTRGSVRPCECRKHRKSPPLTSQQYDMEDQRVRGECSGQDIWKWHIATARQLHEGDITRGILGGGHDMSYHARPGIDGESAGVRHDTKRQASAYKKQ